MPSAFPAEWATRPARARNKRISTLWRPGCPASVLRKTVNIEGRRGTNWAKRTTSCSHTIGHPAPRPTVAGLSFAHREVEPRGVDAAWSGFRGPAPRPAADAARAGLRRRARARGAMAGRRSHTEAAPARPGGRNAVVSFFSFSLLTGDGFSCRLASTLVCGFSRRRFFVPPIRAVFGAGGVR